MYGGCIEVHAGRHQIDWRLVPQAYTLVFCRATMGSRYVDPYLDRNLQGIGDTGRMMIPYLIASAEPAELQCTNFAGSIGLRQGMAVMIAADQQIGLALARPPHDVIRELIRWLRTATGRPPLLRGPDGEVGDCPIVHYKKPDNDDWLFWQRESLSVVPGVPGGRLEHVWWNGTEDELAQFYRSGTLPADRFLPADDSDLEPLTGKALRKLADDVTR